MAQHKSAKKRNRQTIKKTIVNKVHKSKTKNAVKAVRAAIESGDKAAALKLLPNAQKLLARLAQKNIGSKSSAGRKTSRLTMQVNSL